MGEKNVEIVIDDEAGVAAMRRRIGEIEKELEQEEVFGYRNQVCIYRVPPNLVKISPNAIQPEIVSIGPYHRGKEKLLEFESHKWWYLRGLLSREQAKEGCDRLGKYFIAMKKMEKRTKSSYSESISMSSHDFVEMMVLDGCFIVELLRHVCMNNDVIDENDPIISMPWLIAILTRDLLKLENQLPYFVLQTLFNLSTTGGEDPLALLALKFFNLSLPRPIEVLKRSIWLRGPKHILDLFHISHDCQGYCPISPSQAIIFQRTTQLSLGPINLRYYVSIPKPSEVLERLRMLELRKLLDSFQLRFNPPTPDETHKYRPSSQSIQCTTKLRPSGIEFRPHRADSFLEINFRNRVLQIPPLTINDFTIAVFINCMALEQCHPHSSTCFTTYVAFMSCLIHSTRDVTFLCADGIITAFSQNDQDVAVLFRMLGEQLVFNIRNCYLSKQFTDVEAYYSSHRATFLQTYFSRPWSFISLFTAFILLVLTGIQTIMSVLSYVNKK